MPVGNAYQFGPLTAGPFYPEYLPFGFGKAFGGVANNPYDTVNLDPTGDIMRGLTHPWPIYRPGTTQMTQFGRGNAIVGNGITNAVTGVAADAGQQLWDGAKADVNLLGQGLGLMDPPESKFRFYSAGQTPAAKPPQTEAPNPMMDMIKEMMGGANRTFTTSIPGMPHGAPLPPPPAYSPAPDVDASAVRGAFAKAAPSKELPIDKADKFLYMLSALSDRGWNPKLGMGDNILQLAMAAMGVGGKIQDEKIKEEAMLRRDENAYNLKGAELEAGILRDQAGVNRDNANYKNNQATDIWRAQVGANERDATEQRLLWQALMPKISENAVTTYAPDGKGGYIGTTKVFNDKNQMGNLGLMAMASGALTKPTDVAMNVLDNNVPGLTQAEQAQLPRLQIAVQQMYGKMLPDLAKEWATYNGGVPPDMSKPEVMTFMRQAASPRLNQMMQATMPELYNVLQQKMHQALMMKMFIPALTKNQLQD